MKVLVTGSSGMLGRDVCGVLNHAPHDVFGVSKEISHSLGKDRQYVGDLTDRAFIDDVLGKVAPDVIIHCAAIVNVDACEKNRDLVRRIHVDATGELAGYRSGKVGFIYISTDSVFDGASGNYSERDTTNPLNYYAQSKLQGEKAALEKNPGAVILRTNIYGFHFPPGASLAEWAIGNLSQGKAINGFNDALFNPVYTRQLATTIDRCFLSSPSAGIWNVASEGYVSKYEFLVQLARIFGYSDSLVAENSMESVAFIAPRPKKTYLNTEKFKSAFNLVHRLESGLESFRDDYLRAVKTGG